MTRIVKLKIQSGSLFTERLSVEHGNRSIDVRSGREKGIRVHTNPIVKRLSVLFGKAIEVQVGAKTYALNKNSLAAYLSAQATKSPTGQSKKVNKIALHAFERAISTQLSASTQSSRVILGLTKYMSEERDALRESKFKDKWTAHFESALEEKTPPPPRYEASTGVLGCVADRENELAKVRAKRAKNPLFKQIQAVFPSQEYSEATFEVLTDRLNENSQRYAATQLEVIQEVQALLKKTSAVTRKCRSLENEERELREQIELYSRRAERAACAQDRLSSLRASQESDEASLKSILRQLDSLLGTSCKMGRVNFGGAKKTFNRLRDHVASKTDKIKTTSEKEVRLRGKVKELEDRIQRTENQIKAQEAILDEIIREFEDPKQHSYEGVVSDLEYLKSECGERYDVTLSNLTSTKAAYKTHLLSELRALSEGKNPAFHGLVEALGYYVQDGTTSVSEALPQALKHAVEANKAYLALIEHFQGVPPCFTESSRGPRKIKLPVSRRQIDSKNPLIFPAAKALYQRDEKAHSGLYSPTRGTATTTF